MNIYPLTCYAVICFARVEVNLKPEHHVTIGSQQDLQHGPELSPIDPTFNGQDISVTKVQINQDRKQAAQDVLKGPFVK